MAIPWAEIAIAAGQMASSIWGSSAADNASDEAFERQVWLQNHQQQFIEKMANSAHQREIADLKAAGLNPILSAGGQGAATLAGTTPSVAVSNASQHLGKATNLGEIMNWGLQNKALQLQTTKNAYDNEETWAKAMLLQSQNQTEQLNAQLRQQEIIREQIKNENLPKEIKTRINNILADTTLKTAEAIQTRANTTGQEIENIRSKIALQQERQIKGWDERHPKQSGFVTGLGRWTGAIGNIFSGTVSRKIK